jgi:hypothetical protein
MITVLHTRDNDDYRNQQSWASKSVATSSDGSSPCVFVYKRLSQLTGIENSHFFLGVATLDQMQDLSENASDDMYRSDTVELNSLCEDDREIALQDIDYLVDIFNTQADSLSRMTSAENWNVD